MLRPLVQVRNLKKYFPLKGRWFRRSSLFTKAVNDVNIEICPSEIYGLVGESGSGKTTLGRLILRLVEPTEGNVYFNGTDIFALKDLREFRVKTSMIFQNPLASLNPTKTIGHIVSQPYLIHRSLNRKEAKDEALALLERVGLSPPEKFINRYPHELSGGQRQRVTIARSVALTPSFIVADEPVSALDLSIQAQILELLKELHMKGGISFLFITHDLAVVRSLCTKTAIMYLGKIVEVATTEALFSNPLSPYTQTLMASVPVPNPRRVRKEPLIKDVVLSSIASPSGCQFYPRCTDAKPECQKVEPQLVEIDNDHLVSCLLYS